MMAQIASRKVSSSRGQGKERTIKSKPRPKFPVRKIGTTPTATKVEREVRIA